MTTKPLQTVDLSCPVCQNRFGSKTVQSTNSFGGKRTDFHERAVGTQPLPHMIHQCPQCGYSSSEGDFRPDEKTESLIELHPTIAQNVWKEFDRKPKGLAATGSEKYEAAAKCAEWAHASHRTIADLLLRAAWCCRDERDTDTGLYDLEAERYFMRKAALAFEESLSGWDEVPRDERAILTYLVGELWRRVGDLTAAHARFNRVAVEIVDEPTQQWILDAARQQRDYPREWFG